MKNLYEILEVSETASDEVIEKAYKVLAKKYHPDLQTAENKKTAEDTMKKINEAYEILSNGDKRKAYDEELKIKREEAQEKAQREYYEQQKSTYEKANVNSTYVNEQTSSQYQTQEQYNKTADMQRRYEEDLRRHEEKMRQQMQANLEQEYQNAYYNYLRSLGYRIKEKWTWKKTKDLIITILIIIAIFVVLWILPPTHNMLVNFYESNSIVKIIVDIIVGIVTAIFKTVASIFSSN